MREILFRAKRIDNNEWVKGDLTQDRDLGTAYVQGYDYYTDEDGLQREPYCCEIDPETVGQYTGLKDKNGKRIFEGDIVKFKLQDADEYRFAKILYGEFVDENDSQFYLGFYVVGMGCTFSIFNGKDEGYDFIGMCEVCGNVHDHPELLEEL